MGRVSEKAPGCTIEWKHTVTGAQLGTCGMPTGRAVTAACPRCSYQATQRVCDVCWGSYRDYGLCGTCLGPLEITE